MLSDLHEKSFVTQVHDLTIQGDWPNGNTMSSFAKLWKFYAHRGLKEKILGIEAL